jgi:two-component system, LytTR family, response regulator
MTIKCIIVEDEPLAVERIQSFARRLPFIEIINSFDNAIDALLFLKTNDVDLIFLDINLGEMSGIQLLETAKPNCEVIVITAYEEFALKGFELKVTDYLCKPFVFERFYQAVESAQHNLKKNVSETIKDFLFVKTENRLEKILLSDILYIEGMRDYRKIHTAKKPIMTLQNFANFEEIIPSNIICRVHKSYMVSIAKIESVEKGLIKINNIVIPISDTYKKIFTEIITSNIK